MAFAAKWTEEAAADYAQLRHAAATALRARGEARKKKAGKAEGLFKQVHKCIQLLQVNPRHPRLRTHEFSSLPDPYHQGGKVFEAYAQNQTPGAYRVFWCYGPEQGELTIIAITPHP